MTHLPAVSALKNPPQTCYLSSINGHRIDNVKLSNWVGILHKATSAVATQVYSCRIQIILKLNHDSFSRETQFSCWHIPSFTEHFLTVQPYRDKPRKLRGARVLSVGISLTRRQIERNRTDRWDVSRDRNCNEIRRRNEPWPLAEEAAGRIQQKGQVMYPLTTRTNEKNCWWYKEVPG